MKSGFIKVELLDFLRGGDDVVCHTYSVYRNNETTRETYALSDSQRIVLNTCVKAFLKPSSAIDHSVNSYGLKHIFEDIVGFYVSNADMKRAMLECGFTAYRSTDKNYPNWFFKIRWKDVSFISERRQSFSKFVRAAIREAEERSKCIKDTNAEDEGNE